MKKRKFILSFVLITISVFWVGLSSEIVYSQSDDKATVFKTQKKLQELGYNPGPLDGIWGKRTESALKRFQHDNSLAMTGKLDSITKEKLGIISLEKSVPKRSIPVISIQDNIREALKHTWEIEKVQIENDRLTVVPNVNFINKQGYASMILEICRYANVSNQLNEIWLLNASQDQGWVLIQAQKCNQITHAPLNQVDDLIFRYSADILIHKSR
ncbi:MAG: peptidoglycan-binding domain-containing protein [Candidatus Hodarchaeales archaeon]|jgi:hypothetical protein